MNSGGSRGTSRRTISVSGTPSLAISIVKAGQKRGTRASRHGSLTPREYGTLAAP